MQVIRGAVVDMHHGLRLGDVGYTHVLRTLGLVLVSLGKHIDQDEVQIGTQHMGLTPGRRQLRVDGRSGTHLQHGLDGVVADGNTGIVGFPYLIGGVVGIDGIVVDVDPFVGLLVETLIGIVMGGGHHDVVVDIVVATELADDGRRCHGIGRGEQTVDLVGLVNLRTVVGHLIQLVGTGGKGGGQAAADQACRQESIYILQFHHFEIREIRVIRCLET